MKPRVRRIALFSLIPTGLLGIVAFSLVGWARFESGDDLVAKLPAGCEATVRVRSLREFADFLESATGVDARALKQSGVAGKFGGAAAGIRDGAVVAVLECPRLTRFGPLQGRIAEALKLRANPDGSYERGGQKVWLSTAGNLAFFSTSEPLLKEAVALAGKSLQLSPGAPPLEIRDAGLFERFDRLAADHKMGDIEGRVWDRLGGALPRRGAATGHLKDGALELTGSREWTLRPDEVARRAVASHPPVPSRLTGISVPGLVFEQVDPFPSLELWHEIVHDPANGRFVEAFQHEIEQYEKLVGNRDFETDLLPKIGPERALVIARPDWKAFVVRPKTKFPVVMFALECRGIEEEVLKSLDKFLTEAEKEGKKYDLPAPRGRTIPVLDPFSHDRIEVRGQKIIRVNFRDGVSQFGPEVAPGYAVIDGVLWVSSFWPIFPT